MMALLAMTVFTGALALALAAIWSTVAPDWRRIARLATGHVEQDFQLSADLTQGGRRIVVRGWAPAPVRVRSRRQYAA